MQETKVSISVRFLRTLVGPFRVRGMQSSSDFQELTVEPFKFVGVQSSGEACEPLSPSLASVN